MAWETGRGAHRGWVSTLPWFVTELDLLVRKPWLDPAIAPFPMVLSNGRRAGIEDPTVASRVSAPRSVREPKPFVSLARNLVMPPSSSSSPFQRAAQAWNENSRGALGSRANERGSYKYSWAAVRVRMGFSIGGW